MSRCRLRGCTSYSALVYCTSRVWTASMPCSVFEDIIFLSSFMFWRYRDWTGWYWCGNVSHRTMHGSICFEAWDRTTCSHMRRHISIGSALQALQALHSNSTTVRNKLRDNHFRSSEASRNMSPRATNANLAATAFLRSVLPYRDFGLLQKVTLDHNGHRNAEPPAS